jgi:hypothetical protein
LVDRNDGRADTNSVTANSTADTEKSDAVGGGLEDSANNPDERGDLNSVPTRQAIGKEGRGQGTDKRTRWHRRRNTTLASTAGITEVVLVSWGTQCARHRRDVETKEDTTKGGKAANGVDVVDLWKL